MNIQTKNLSLLALAAAASSLFGASGCRAIKGIFDAGVWVGVVIVGFLALVLFGVSRLFTRA